MWLQVEPLPGHLFCTRFNPVPPETESQKEQGDLQPGPSPHHHHVGHTEVPGDAVATFSETLFLTHRTEIPLPPTPASCFLNWLVQGLEKGSFFLARRGNETLNSI